MPKFSLLHLYYEVSRSGHFRVNRRLSQEFEFEGGAQTRTPSPLASNSLSLFPSPLLLPILEFGQGSSGLLVEVTLLSPCARAESISDGSKWERFRVRSGQEVFCCAHAWSCMALSENSKPYKTSGLPFRSQLELRTFQFPRRLLINSTSVWIGAHERPVCPV